MEYNLPYDLVRRILLAVTVLLPDRNKDLKSVPWAVIDMTSVPTDQQAAAIALIEDCIKVLPRCYGLERKPTYWTFMEQHLQPADRLECYLGQFPDNITGGQWSALVKALMKCFDLTEEEAWSHRQRFDICWAVYSHAQRRHERRGSGLAMCHKTPKMPDAWRDLW